MITRSRSALAAVGAASTKATNPSGWFRGSKASLATPATTSSSPKGIKRSISDSTLVAAESPAKKPRRGGPASASLAVAGPTAKVHVETKIDIPDVSEAELVARTTLPHPTLPFSYDEALSHLTSCDLRFERLVNIVPIRTYEELSHPETGEPKELDLYRTLTTSILGQQISWLAARSILYKFCRVFDESMPPKPDFAAYPRESWPFPSPLAVLRTSDARLREAGLSFAKIKYVKDIAIRFCDGRLDVREIVELDQEAIMQKLCEVKGVGRWTSEMILMFAIRAPDILPVGDLGVQKGMLNFFLSGERGPKISVKKRKPGAEKWEQDSNGAEASLMKAESSQGAQEPSWAAQVGIPIPEGEGLSRKVLQDRHRGNKVKGQYLTPKEMDSLAQSWRPYRSVACMYMWALVDA